MKTKTIEDKYITVDYPPPRAEYFRKQQRQPYFKAQVKANVYLGRQFGNMLLAGEPQKNGEELLIPVYHGRIGVGKPIGSLRADAHTFELLEEPNLLCKLREVTSELDSEDAS